MWRRQIITKTRAVCRASSASRAFADKPADIPPPVSDAFKDAFKKAAPNLQLPKFPSQFMKPRPPVPGTLPTKLTVNFVLPYKSEMDAQEVDMIIVPATTGQMGILPGHVPTIAELKPGIMSVHEGSEVKQFFVSGGFAFVHPNSVADVTVVDAYPLDVFDAEEVKRGLADFTQKSAAATTDSEKAEAEIGVQVHSALSAALGLS
ncbi:hypothetical protein KP509_20G073900 [Ceratopteris richardii]|uniref:ATP synthase F1 complex delta/epsilon subunit N-terminal domain-containing protein n=1 Tax=Ceratopteris richardii TaxID=49495 RepID=A0A8T2SGA0_CERRI|nr:hypothetical protein KP509_20G073900 [Ceratopteris richardii]